MTFRTALSVWLGMSVFIFVGPLIGSLWGMAAGWVVGLVFGDLVLRFLAEIGIEGFAMWQVGACLGFLGSFFRANTISKEDPK